ncbi:MAG TPA: hypothetical protein VHH73_04615 [Verrucomicrobiae bacterium]|nr:hypothetical protein [Verrucomicrobiae bacterium]
MVAIGILGMLMVTIYASWSAILRGAKVGQDASAEAQRSRMALRCLEDALMSAQLFSQNMEHYTFFADTSGDYAYLSVAARLPGSFPGAGIYEGQVVRRVTFSVEPSPAGNQLVMRQMPLFGATNAAEDLSYRLPLARDVSAFGLEFWNTNRNEWNTDWPFTNQLPRMVRVTLGFGRANQYFNRPKDVVTRQILLSSLAIPAAYQGGIAPTGQGVQRTTTGNMAPPPPR